jgi:hypothetical protein
MIVVHQMAKVASLAWVEAAREVAAQQSTVPIHSHFITGKNLDEITSALTLPGDRQTISNLLIPRDFVRKGRSAAIAIAGARMEGRDIQLISGIRDPVARSLSVMSFLADFCGHRRRPLSGRDAGASVEEVVDVLVRTWQSIYTGDVPHESFEWLLFRMVGLFRSWFTEELLDPLGVDVRAAKSAGGGALRACNANVQALFYRVEDMVAGVQSYDRLRSSASDFLQAPLAPWPLINRSESRHRSQAFNERVRAAFRLPTGILDAIYNEPIVALFYQPAEIAAFRRSWS